MPTDEEPRASVQATRSLSARVPGAWQALVIAAVSALAFGYWARPGDAAPGPEAAATMSRVDDVAPQELPAALDTMSWSPEQLAAFNKQEACARRLAWVMVRRSPGQPPGRIRLRSGGYVSPAFDLADAPVRVGLPFPAPFATGHGVIAVVGTTTDAIVALTPPWPVPARDGTAAREVTWNPVGGCPGAGR